MYGLTKVYQGERVLVGYILGERVLEVADIVAETTHGTVIQFHTHAWIDCEGYYSHSYNHSYAKHIRDAAPRFDKEAEEMYQLRTYATIDKALRRSCQQHGLESINVPGGESPLVNSHQMVVADFSMSGSHWYIIEVTNDDATDYSEDYKKITGFAERISKQYA